MPTREQVMEFIKEFLWASIRALDEAWISLYRLFLDYAHGVPRITDSNRLRGGAWRQRALEFQGALAVAIGCNPDDLEGQLDVLMRALYPAGTQRMNPIGIGFACAIACLGERFCGRRYVWRSDARIGKDVFPGLSGYRRKTVDIVALVQGTPYAALSTKWGIRHDRLRDAQEEANTYKLLCPSIKFFVVTNEFDSARLGKLLNYPGIDGVFHVRSALVRQAYRGAPGTPAGLRDLCELFPLLP